MFEAIPPLKQHHLSPTMSLLQGQERAKSITLLHTVQHKIDFVKGKESLCFSYNSTLGTVETLLTEFHRVHIDITSSQLPRLNL